MEKEAARIIVGKNIIALRQMRKLSLNDFAEAIGITPGFLGLIERGRRGITGSVLMSISEVFKISIDELIKAERPTDSKD